ncbi:MAG: hypothetical protein AAF656_10500 [Planctomycetota bacterium]
MPTSLVSSSATDGDATSADEPVEEDRAGQNGVGDDTIAFDCFDAHTCAEKLLDHCQRVVTDCSRVEMRLDDGNVAVLMSKCELDALEQALAMLSDMTEGEAMHNRLRALADCMQKELLTDKPDGEPN